MATRNRIITALPVGRSNAIKVRAFGLAVGNPRKGTNDDNTRNEVTALINNEDIPIGSGHRGYWLIDSDAECAAVLDSIDEKIATYKKKRDAIERGWNRRKASKNAGTPWPK